MQAASSCSLLVSGTLFQVGLMLACAAFEKMLHLQRRGISVRLNKPGLLCNITATNNQFQWHCFAHLSVLSTLARLACSSACMGSECRVWSMRNIQPACCIAALTSDGVSSSSSASSSVQPTFCSSLDSYRRYNTFAGSTVQLQAAQSPLS